jgi:hypothetical protein
MKKKTRYRSSGAAGKASSGMNTGGRNAPIMLDEERKMDGDFIEGYIHGDYIDHFYHINRVRLEKLIPGVRFEKEIIGFKP